jgi:alcohol dehydrogenase
MAGSEVLHINVPTTLFGAGALNEVGDLVQSFAPSKVLIVSDAGVTRTGIVDKVRLKIAASGIGADVFDQCGVEAPISVIQRLAEKVRAEGYDLLVAVGGGSTMDSTKAASVLAADPGLTAQDLIQMKPVTASVKKIMIPTTAGTGSEWSSAAVLTNDTEDDRTYPYFTAANYPDAVIIDPELSLELPAAATAHTGIDALTHAIEAFTCCRATMVSDMFASTAIQLIATSLRPAFAKGCQNLEHRSNLAFAAASAMAAGSLAGVGLAHFMNHGLGKRAGISHGSAVGLMLPYVMEFNLVSDPPKFARLAQLLGEVTDGLSVIEAGELAIEGVRRLLSDLGMPQTLHEVGLTKDDIPWLVDELMTFQAFPISFMNPRDVDSDAATSIYTSAL